MRPIVKSVVTLLLLAPYVILVAMTTAPLLALCLLAFCGACAWILTWYYADLKAQGRLGKWGTLLFLPFFMVTGTFGLLFWIVFEPEAQRRAWHQRDRR